MTLSGCTGSNLKKGQNVVVEKYLGYLKMNERKVYCRGVLAGKKLHFLYFEH